MLDIGIVVMVCIVVVLFGFVVKGVFLVLVKSGVFGVFVIVVVFCVGFVVFRSVIVRVFKGEESEIVSC